MITQEDIQKAAIEFCEIEEQDPWTNAYGGHCFIAGARWRIDSVWHDIDNELPECGKHVVNEDWFDFIAKDEKDLQRIIKKYPFKLWAYVADLLPERKEEEK